MKKLWLWGILGGLVLGIFMVYSYYKSNFNREVQLGEDVTAQWANVESQYQKRLDLIPNLVNIVKGYMNFEKETLIGVVEARAKATSIQVDPSKLTPEAINSFAQSQAGVSSALGRLLVTIEKYPDLKANQSVGELQAQLEGVENRISVERQRFNEKARTYNTFIREFPRSLIFKWDPKPYFESDAAAAKAPKVEF